MPQNIDIVFLEDDLEEWELIKQALSKYGIPESHITFFSTSISMLASLPASPGKVVIVDYQLKHDVITGDQVIKDARQICPDCYFIIVTGHADRLAMISFIKNKADDFFEKDEINYYDKLVEGIILGRKEVKRRNEISKTLEDAKKWLEERVDRLSKKIADIKPKEDDNRASY